MDSNFYIHTLIDMLIIILSNFILFFNARSSLANIFLIKVSKKNRYVNRDFLISNHEPL